MQSHCNFFHFQDVNQDILQRTSVTQELMHNQLAASVLLCQDVGAGMETEKYFKLWYHFGTP